MEWHQQPKLSIVEKSGEPISQEVNLVQASLSGYAPSPHDIREELDRIRQSTIFANSERITRFLQFTVEQALAGNADKLKEYVIGVEVYDRKPPYHPGEDSIVRTEARRLRRKLKEYYESEGKTDPVFIYFRPGSYAPVFRVASSVEAQPEESKQKANSPTGSGISIAVLPFNTLTDDPLTRTCANGLTHELIDAFNKTDGFQVVAERSSVQIASQSLAIPQIAQNLGVQFLIDGTVATEGDRCRATAQLVHQDGFQIWSERFETHLERDSVFQVLERIASALVSRVRSSCGNIENSQDQASPSKVAAYHQILTAEALLSEGRSDHLQEGLRRFEAIVRTVPDYARAHAGIAGSHCLVALSGAPGSALAVARGKDAVLRAISMQPDMIAAHSWLGYLSALEWKWNEAELSFKKALSLGGSATSRRHFAQFLCALERFDEAWSLLQQSEQEDSFSQEQKMAHCRYLYISRQFGEMRSYAADGSIYGAQPPESRVYLALSQMQLGHRGVARDMAHELRSEAGSQPAMMGRIAEILALCDDKEQAVNLVNDWRLLARDSPLSLFRQTLLLLALGDPAAALSVLAKALDEREPELMWLGSEPAFDSVRKHPAFLQILERIKPEQQRFSASSAG